MTCDIQGLDHAIGRKAKAYFIMLYRSVRMALEQGYDYVNFGPTTLGPKTDAGAVLVPATVGLYALSPVIRVFTFIGTKSFASHQAQSYGDAVSTAVTATIGPGGTMRSSAQAADADDEAPHSGQHGATAAHGTTSGAGAAAAAMSVVAGPTGACAGAAPAAGAGGDEIDIEVLMAMDMSQMTGAQKKRYNKEKKKRTAKAAKSAGGAGAAGAVAGSAADAEDKGTGEAQEANTITADQQQHETRKLQPQNECALEGVAAQQDDFQPSTTAVPV